MKTKGRSNKLELTALQEGIILMIKQKKKGQKISLSEIEAFRRDCRIKYRSISEAELDKIFKDNLEQMVTGKYKEQDC